MSRIDKFKSYLSNDEKFFLEGLEPSIFNFFDEAVDKNIVNIIFTPYQINRLIKLIDSSNSAKKLYNNLIGVIDGDQELIKHKINALEELDINLDGKQIGTIVCHNYQVISERLKLYLVTFLDFDVLNVKDAHKKPLGRILNQLQDEFPKNKFIQSLNTNIRNSVTHYTYFFEDKYNKIHFCNGVFDYSPNIMKLSEFRKNSNELNILTEAFFIIYKDKFFPGDNLFLDK